MKLNKIKIEIYNKKGEVLKEPYLSMAEKPVLDGKFTKYNPYCMDLKERFNFKRTNEGKTFWREVYKGNSPQITNKIKCDYNHIFNDTNQKIKDYLDKCFKIDNNDSKDHDFNFDNDPFSMTTSESRNIKFSGNVLELKSILLSIYEYIGNNNIHEIKGFDLSRINPELNIEYETYEIAGSEWSRRSLDSYILESLNIRHAMTVTLVLNIQYYKIGDGLLTSFSIERSQQDELTSIKKGIIPFNRTPFTIYSKITYKGENYIGNIDSGFYNFTNLDKLNLEELSDTNYTISNLSNFELSLDYFDSFNFSGYGDFYFIMDKKSSYINYLMIDKKYNYLFKVSSSSPLDNHDITSYFRETRLDVNWIPNNILKIKNNKKIKITFSYEDKLKYLKNPKLVEEIEENPYLLPQ